MKKIILLSLIFFIGCTNINIPQNLTEETCTGFWNECSSPCLGTDADYCIQVCKAQCECFDDFKCPRGYECKVGSFSEKGVCVRS